jgi:hypothetical protein
VLVGFSCFLSFAFSVYYLGLLSNHE